MKALTFENFIKVYGTFLNAAQLRPKNYMGEVPPRNPNEQRRWLTAWADIYEAWLPAEVTDDGE